MQKDFKILLIDDSKLVCSIIKLALAKEGYEVLTTDSTVGIAKYITQTDLFIIDYNMPGMCGNEVVHNLKHVSRHLQKQPLYYLYTTESEKAASYKEYGFDGVLNNKGNMDSLIAQINSIYSSLKHDKKTQQKQ